MFSFPSSGRLYATMPVTLSRRASSSHWYAYIDPRSLNPQNPSIFISSPASASVGSYRFKLFAFTQGGQRSHAFGKFTILCNPWCSGEFRPLNYWKLYNSFKVSRRVVESEAFGRFFLWVANVAATVS